MFPFQNSKMKNLDLQKLGSLPVKESLGVGFKL